MRSQKWKTYPVGSLAEVRAWAVMYPGAREWMRQLWKRADEEPKMKSTSPSMAQFWKNWRPRPPV